VQLNKLKKYIKLSN